MMASMFSSFMVGPKGSVSYTKSSSMSGLIVLMNSLASCILISKDWMISWLTFFWSICSLVTPMITFFSADNIVWRRRTWWPMCKWSNVPPTATVLYLGLMSYPFGLTKILTKGLSLRNVMNYQRDEKLCLDSSKKGTRKVTDRRYGCWESSESLGLGDKVISRVMSIW